MITDKPANMTTNLQPDKEAPVYTFQSALQSIENGEPVSQAVQTLLSGMTESERLSLLDGDMPFWDGMRAMFSDRYNRIPFVHGAIPRLQIPGICFSDGPRGVVMGSSTAFPVSMARGATWDTVLEERVGHAIGLEAKAQGANYFGGICINLPRHPAWGRIQETYGEDPIILGEFGLALMRGVQKHVMGCVKHYALNSMENARFRVNVSVEEAVLHEVYLAHFRRVVDGGVASVMSAYNSVNGEWAGQNKQLLTDVLRNQWGFDGFVISDFVFGLRDAVLSVKAGLDIEAPFIQQRGVHLQKGLQSGTLDWSDIDTACTRILKKELRFSFETKSSQPDMSVVFCQEHRDLAREVARRSMVLLKNNAVQGKPLLPLDTYQVQKFAVIGRLANAANTGDKGSSQVFPPEVITPVDGLKAALPNTEIVVEDSDSPENARQLAADVDFVICIVGYDAADEGEYIVPSLQDDPLLYDLFPPPDTDQARKTAAVFQGIGFQDKADTGIKAGTGGDRKSLRLRSRDVEIIEAVCAVNPRVVVSVVAAGAVIMEEWRDRVPTILMQWYCGSEGGHGLADVLLGRVDASGRLPFSVPKDEAHLPFMDPNATQIQYDRWYGQHLLDKLSVPAAFPFGFGLSYTSFDAADLRVISSDPETESVLLAMTVINAGSRRGRYVAQSYSLPQLTDFPYRVLLGFAVEDLEPAQSKEIMINTSLRPIQRWVNGAFVYASDHVEIEVGTFAGDPGALRITHQL